jgi:hypothetical protein
MKNVLHYLLELPCTVDQVHGRKGHFATIDGCAREKGEGVVVSFQFNDISKEGYHLTVSIDSLHLLTSTRNIGGKESGIKTSSRSTLSY